MVRKVLVTAFGIMTIAGLAHAQAFVATDATSGSGCNGGTCQSSTGTTLSCPTSGGPTCNTDQTCECYCNKHNDGSVSAVNRCVKPPPSASVLNGIDLDVR